MMVGTFVAVVGASGAGKDSLINYARDSLGDQVAVVRRVVTRVADGGSEDHESMSVEDFAASEQEGLFALSWEAHGLSYGLPIALEDDLAAGRVVIANLSRAALPRLVARYPNALVVEVTAAPEVIARRLAGRGREGGEDIRRRLERGSGFRLPSSTVSIDNSGALETAGVRFVTLLRDLLRLPA
jgi:ribose 1,5-bisphosphokinase